MGAGDVLVIADSTTKLVETVARDVSVTRATNAGTLPIRQRVMFGYGLAVG